MMDQLIARFVEQLEEALSIGEKAVINKHNRQIRNIYVAGLGGSGIGANFVQEFVREELKIPFIVGKGYSAPRFVGKNSLVIISSYSGNTEETLSSFEQIKDSGAKIVCVASGGKVISYAKEMGLDFIQVPGNWPSPRACLGYSLVQQLFILNKLRLISKKSIQRVGSAVKLLKKNSEEIKNRAKRLATQLHGKIPVIYTTDRMEAVAVRFRQQINENAKALCWHHVIPEMNHNELVGWTGDYKNVAVVYLRNVDDYSRNAIRIDINKEIIAKHTDTIIELKSKGRSLIEKALYFVHLVDWTTFYLSELREVDSIEVDVIDYLKSQLAKV